MAEISCQEMQIKDEKCQICGQAAKIKIIYGDSSINTCLNCKNKALELIYMVEGNFQE